MNEPIAQWSGASKHYGAVAAARDVSLALRSGEVTALVGHNGAGKTTLIKLLLGLIRPTSGSVSVMGMDPAGPRGAETRQSLGFLPENVAFHGAMTATELMAFYARLKGQRRERNGELLELVGLTQAANRRVATYSKGMRQRLGLAQALIGDPKLLLFDEPTSGLDPASRAEVYAMFGRLRTAGATILVSTHALSEVEHRVDRVAVMHSGALLAAGTLEELRHRVETETRLLLRVRPCTTGQVLERLGPSVRCGARDEASLEIWVRPAEKMQVLRGIAGMQDLVVDLDMTTPGLEELYRRLVEEAGEAR